MRRIVSVFLSLVMVISLSMTDMVVFDVSADASLVTVADAVLWAENEINKSYDGQCVAFIKLFAKQKFNITLPSLSYAKQYIDIDPPDGWKIHRKDDQGFELLPGDIMVWTKSNRGGHYGHVAVCLSYDKDTDKVIVADKYSDDRTVHKTTYTLSKDYGGSFCGIIRPNYADYNQVAVTFNIGDKKATAPTKQVIISGTTAKKPNGPTIVGSTVVGWYTDKALKKEWDFNTKVTKDMTLYAKWENKETSVVSFNLNGYNGKEIASKKINKDTRVKKPADPVRPGYEFGGWYKEASCKNKWDFNNKVTEKTMTLYAKWVKVDFVTVTFNLNGSGGSTIDKQIIKTGTKATKPTDPVRLGYEFGGWYKEASCKNKWNFNDKVTEKTMTLYAKWVKVDLVTVTFNLNGSGGSTIDKQIIKTGTKATKPSNPSREGYDFGGWYKESSCKNKWDFNSKVNKNVTLYARWTKNEIIEDTLPQEILVDDECGINYPRPTRALQSGARGDDVKWLQTALNRTNNARLSVDGSFGPATLSAVEDFQWEYDLSVDGSAGPKTRNKLVDLLTGRTTKKSDEPKATPAPEYKEESPKSTQPITLKDQECGIDYYRPTRALQSGAKGDDVRWLQTALNMIIDAGLSIDGSFGPATLSSVKDFQSRYGLSVDGSAGPLTREKIVSILRG